jgi:hypothetical protein
MFAGWKVAGAIGLVGLLAFGFMYAKSKSLEADLATSQAALLDVQRVNASLRSQNVTLQTALSDSEAQRLRDKDKARRDDAAAAELVANLQADKDRLTREIEHAFTIDDGPAAPILQYAANSLRLRSEAIGALRARHDHPDGDGGVDLARGDDGDLPAAFSTWPTSQREFAILAMKFGDYALEHATKLAAIEDRIAEEKARTSQPP